MHTRPDHIGGVAPTFATLLVWNELHWRYDEIVDCTRDRDATADYRALHAPPMVYVVSIRRYAGRG
jgi:hypothetical protein